VAGLLRQGFQLVGDVSAQILDAYTTDHVIDGLVVADAVLGDVVDLVLDH